MDIKNIQSVGRVVEMRHLRNALDSVMTEHNRRCSSESREDLIEKTHQLENESLKLGVIQFCFAAAKNRAQIQESSKQYESAANTVEVAKRYLKSYPAVNEEILLLTVEARCYAGIKNWNKVAEICDYGISLVEPERRKVSPALLQSAYLRFRGLLYELGIYAHHKLGNVERYLTIIELVKSRFLGAQKLKSRKRIDRSNLIMDYSALCKSIDQAVSKSGDVENLLKKRRSLWHLLQIENRKDNEQEDLEFSLRNLQKNLPRDAVFIQYYWLTGTQLLIICIDCDYHLEEVVELEARQKNWIDRRASLLQSANPAQSAAGMPENLTKLLLPEKVNVFIREKKCLFISPHRVLHTLPFHALSWEGKFLIESYAISYYPNASCVLRNSTISTSSPKVLAIGVEETKIAEGGPFGKINNANEEVKALSDIYGESNCKVLMNSDASSDVLEGLNKSGQICDYSILHFTCHGNNIKSDNPMESELFLYDSILDGLDIVKWQLKANLVVLTSCCAGQRAIKGRGMKELPGDDLAGLPAAFFAAGSKQIISALWPVKSTSGERISYDFHSFLKTTYRPDLALQYALTNYINDARKNDVHRLASYYWAPLFLYCSCQIN